MDLAAYNREIAGRVLEAYQRLAGHEGLMKDVPTHPFFQETGRIHGPFSFPHREGSPYVRVVIDVPSVMEPADMNFDGSGGLWKEGNSVYNKISCPAENEGH